VLVGGLLVPVTSPVEPTPREFTATAPISTALIWQEASVLADGTVFITGGTTDPDGALTTAEVSQLVRADQTITVLILQLKPGQLG
jgi:hypothetical protein